MIMYSRLLCSRCITSLKHKSLRHYSPFSSGSLVKNTKNVNDQDLNSHKENLLKKLQTTNGDSGLVNDIIRLAQNDLNLSTTHIATLHNFVIKTFCKTNYSLSTIHQRELEKINGRLEIEALTEIIKHNPGRVKTSWEIFESAFPKIASMGAKEPLLEQQLFKAVLEKLINGDSSDHEDGYKISDSNLIRSIYMFKCINDPQPEIYEMLLNECINKDMYELIPYLGIDSFEQISDPRFSFETFTKLYFIWNPQSLAKDVLVKYSEVFGKLILRLTETDHEVFDPLVIQEKITQINREIRKLNDSFKGDKVDLLDLDITKIEDRLLHQLKPIANDPSSNFFQLRKSILKVYGMNQSNLSQSLMLYHKYIIFDKAHVTELMSVMVSVLSHLSVQLHDSSYLIIAESLVPSPTPIKCLQSLILAYSNFDTDKSLELYNNNIQGASKELNSDGCSARCSLTESLVLAFLSQNNREFAFLINDGAYANGIVTEDIEKMRLKAIFKRYGEIIGTDSEDLKVSFLKKEVLKAIYKL